MRPSRNVLLEVAALLGGSTCSSRLSGPFFPKVVVANLLSDVGRDLYAGAIIYCGHVGARDFENGTEAPTRAHWYAMQAEAARDVRLPRWMSILAGGLDYQIEHHLFPRLPPNRSADPPRVRYICEAHHVAYVSTLARTCARSSPTCQLVSRDAAPRRLICCRRRPAR